MALYYDSFYIHIYIYKKYWNIEKSIHVGSYSKNTNIRKHKWPHFDLRRLLYCNPIWQLIKGHSLLQQMITILFLFSVEWTPGYSSVVLQWWCHRTNTTTFTISGVSHQLIINCVYLFWIWLTSIVLVWALMTSSCDKCRLNTAYTW